MLKLLPLGSDGIAFVKAQLEHGDQLAQAVAKLPIETGSVYTFLPEHVDLANVSLEYGGTTRYQLGSGDDVDAPFLRLTERHLSESQSLAVAETTTISGSELPESFVQGMNFDVFFAFPSTVRSVDRDSGRLLPLTGVFGYLSSEKGASEYVENLFRFSGPLPIFLVALTSFPATEGLVPRQIVSLDLFHRLAEQTRYLILNAYDDEAFVVWCRDPQSAERELAAALEKTNNRVIGTVPAVVY